MDFLKTFDAIDWYLIGIVAVALLISWALIWKVSRDTKKLDKEH